MSVINQMLRDLEQRKVAAPASNHYIDEVNIIAKTPANLWRPLLAIIIAIIIVVSVYLLFSNQQAADNNRLETIILDLPAAVTAIPRKPETTRITTPEVIKKPAQQSSQQSTQHSIQQPSQKPVQKKHSIEAEKKSIKQTNAEVKSTVVNLVKTSVKKKQDKKSSAELIQQARVLMEDDQNEAITLLENNVQKISPNADYYAMLANLYQRQHHYDEAIVFYRKALNVKPDSGEIWIGIALAYRETGETDNSEMAFNKAISSNTLSPALKQYAEQQIIKE